MKKISGQAEEAKVSLGEYHNRSVKGPLHKDLSRLALREFLALEFMLNVTGAMVSRVVRLRFRDICDGEVILLPACGRFAEQQLALTPELRAMTDRRRKRCPHDIYLFQSHSNRVRSAARPVTVIAFNQALKKAAANVIMENISSKSVRLLAHKCRPHMFVAMLWC